MPEVSYVCFSFNPYNRIRDTIVTPILQMGKPRLRDVK